MAQQPSANRHYLGAVPTTIGAVIATDSSTYAIVTSIRLVNNDSADHTVSMWIVPSGGSVDNNANMFLPAEVVKAGTVNHETQLGVVLEPGDTVYMLADGAGVSCFISGASLASI